jgi:hypothetical protein
VPFLSRTARPQYHYQTKRAPSWTLGGRLACTPEIVPRVPVRSQYVYHPVLEQAGSAADSNR